MAQSVEVLYDFESKTAKGHAVNVQAGERYSLINPGSNDEWCLVCRPNDAASQFYLPKSYVRSYVEQPPDSPVSTFLPTHRHSVTPDLEGRARQSSMFSTDGIYHVLSATAPNPNSQRRLQPSPSRKSPGFKLADPKRISNSIPGDLNFVHNISDLAAAQDIDDRNRLRRDDDEERKPLTAVPRRSLATNGFNGVEVNAAQPYGSSEGLQRAASFSPSTSPAKNMMESRLIRTPVKPDEQTTTLTVEPTTHHYQNVQELESAAADRPPAPDVSDEPVRVLNDGWVEYSLSGRPYFFHQQTGHSQWKPPRLLATPAEVSAMLSSSGDELDTSTYSATEDLQRSHTSDTRSVSQSPTIRDTCGPPPLEQAPPTPAELSQSPPKESSATMTDSVDSGLGRTSLSLRNNAYGMRLPGAPTVDGNYDAYMCSEDLANVIGADMMAQGAGNSYGRNSTMPMHFQQQKTIKNGSLDKCKTAEAGHKLRKKEWLPCFVFLTSAHMIFYKDEKSAEKYGKHYPAPLGVCDLRGARLSWVDKERDKRRKHVFQLELIDGTSYLFSTVNSQDINGWFHALRQVIAKLPLPDFYPTPVVVLEQEHVRRGSLIGRSSSSLTASSSGIGRLRLDSTGGGAAALTVDKQAKKSKRRSAYVGNGPPPLDDEQFAATSLSGADASQTRDTIIERLRRFFRSRPTIESLKEKGIYKPEPVFGSTLVEISQRERLTVPKFVRTVTEVIEAKGLDVDGLYRVSGNLSSIQKIRCQVDQDNYRGLLSEDDVHVLTGALKLFFRELQEPVFPLHMTKDLLNAIRLQNVKQRFKTFEDLLGKMPRTHQETLHLLLKHLGRVANHSAQNRMQMHNLAIVFGPTLFCNGAADKPLDKTGKDKLKPVKRSSTGKVSVTLPPPPSEAVQSNSHLAFNMIMQGQIVEYLLKEQDKFHFMGS